MRVARALPRCLARVLGGSAGLAPAQASDAADAGVPVPDDEWTASSQDSWYVMVPVTHAAVTPPLTAPTPPAPRVHLDWAGVTSLVDSGIQPMSEAR